MKKLIAFIFSSCLFVIPIIVSAQENEVEMADVMRTNGKIYVVVTVLSIALLGLLLFLIRIDKKVNRLENKHGKE